jgi:hypothetical protein
MFCSEKVLVVKQEIQRIKKFVMKTQLSSTLSLKEVTESLLAMTRPGKMISAADVWNIQRNKRNRVQRRFVL